MDSATKKILEIVTDTQEQLAVVRSAMATKDDIRNLQEQITANTKAIAELSEQLRGVLGYAKEIDMLMARMTAVEKHLGIKLSA